MELTNEEKKAIIMQHYKSSVENVFNIQLNIIQENASPTPNQETISALNSNLEIERSKQKVLNDQLDLLQ